MREADTVIDHLLYLEGVPNMQRLGRGQVGENVAEHLQLALQLEQNQAATLAAAITHCADVSDFTTRGMLEGMIRGEEADIDRLETIRQVGSEQYLSQHIQETSGAFDGPESALGKSCVSAIILAIRTGIAADSTLSALPV